MYVEPAAPPVEGEPGTLFADSRQSQSNDTGVTRFTGNVQIRQGTNRLSADKGTYNQNSLVVTLEDNVIAGGALVFIWAERKVAGQ